MSGHLDLILLCCLFSMCVFILIILLYIGISKVLYKFKKDYELLKEDNELLKKQVEELIDFKLKLQEKNKKEYDWLNTEWNNINFEIWPGSNNDPISELQKVLLKYLDYHKNLII